MLFNQLALGKSRKAKPPHIDGHEGIKNCDEYSVPATNYTCYLKGLPNTIRFIFIHIKFPQEPNSKH